MSVMSFPWSRSRSRQNVSTLSLQTQTSDAGSTSVISSPTSPYRRNRLRKRPTMEKPTPKAASPPQPIASSCSRGTLGGFCPIDDLEKQQTPNPEEKKSVIKGVGRKIGLGLRLRNDSPTDLRHIVDGTESWYIPYPPPTPTFPDIEVEYLDSESGVESDSSSQLEESDTSSLRSKSSSVYTSNLSLIFDENADGGQVPVETLINSAQTLADQYRSLLSRAPTPGQYLFQVSPENSDVLAPLPLRISQNRRPKRRLSQKKSPNIPPRQHFKLSTPEKTLRKVQARHSLHKFIDVSEYEHIFKSSRLSECSTLVSSKQNTPLSTPRTEKKGIEAFPQTYVANLDRANTPGLPRRSSKRGLGKAACYGCDESLLRAQCMMYDFVEAGKRRNGGAEWEIWI